MNFKLDSASAHNRNFELLYQTLIEKVINENKKLGEYMGIRQYNNDKLYFEKHLEEENITIRHIKIPTFIKNNKPQYFQVFLVNIDEWKKDSIKSIHNSCMNYLDLTNFDSYRIYLEGKAIGYFNYKKEKSFLTKYRTTVFNTEHKKPSEVRAITLRNIYRYLISKCERFENKINSKTYKYEKEGEIQIRRVHLFGLWKKTVNRLKDFCEGVIKNFGMFFLKKAKAIMKEREQERNIISSCLNEGSAITTPTKAEVERREREAGEKTIRLFQNYGKKPAKNINI